MKHQRFTNEFSDKKYQKIREHLEKLDMNFGFDFGFVWNVYGELRLLGVFGTTVYLYQTRCCFLQHNNILQYHNIV